MKTLLVLTLAFLIALPAYSQFSVGLGPKAALVLTSASYNPDLPSQYSKSSRTAFAFGLQVETSIAGPMYAQVEVKYLQGGTIVDISGLVNQQTGQPFSAKITAKSVYFELPVLLKAKFSKGPVRPFVLAGPSVGILLAAKTLVEAAGFGSSEEDAKDGTNSTNFSLVFGGGVEFMATPRIGITAEGRYLLGLSDVAKEVAGETSHTKIKGRGFLFAVGALFYL
jgi:opacity protein-like surface antigen